MTDRKIRVLHVLGSLNPGGVESWLMHVLRNSDSSRFEMHFCTLGPHAGALAPEAERRGGRVYSCPLKKNIWTARQRFSRLLYEGRYDIVHSHVYQFSGAVLRCATDARVPVRIAHSHTTRDAKKNSIFRTAYRRVSRNWIHRYATHGLAASQPASAALFGADWQHDARFRVLYYGLDLEEFAAPSDQTSLRRELEIPEDAIIFGHVGRFIRGKNHAFLLQVAREVLRRCPQARFLFVGDGPLKNESISLANTLHLNGRVRFLGVRSDVPRLLSAMDAFVFPSLWEGLGLALLEAQAAGLPCLASDAVPFDGVVVPGLVHFLPLSAGAAAWADKLCGIVDQSTPCSCERMKLFRDSPFSIEHSVRLLSELYSQSLARV